MKQKNCLIFAILSYMLLVLSPVHATVIDTKLSTVAPIMNASCLACHSSPASTKLNHTNTLSWINSSLVVPGDSSKSRLLTVFTSNIPPAMASIKLSTNDLATLKLWIDQIKVTCSVINSKIDYTKGDGCSCLSGFDEIRTSTGGLTECRKPTVITCNAQFSLINPSMPDGCGCVNNYTEQRDSNKKLISCTPPINSSANNSSEVELKRYSRCYAHLTRSAISNTDPRIALIKSKQMTGTKACMELLEKATFNSAGVINKNSNGENDIQGMQILSTFQKFHMSWFTNLDWATTAGDVRPWYPGTYELFYYGEAALLMTNALFNKTVPYSSVVTSDKALQAVRHDPYGSKFSVTDSLKYGYFKSYFSDESTPWTPNAILKTGNLIGVATIKADYIPYSYTLSMSNIEYKLPSGGGVLGSVPYFILNNGRGFSTKTNGGASTYRRWSKQIFKDVLCRDVPVIRSSDAAFLRQTMPPSKLSFRNGNSCLQCHFSMDGLAGSVRNKTLGTTGIGGGDYAHNLLIAKFNTTEPAETNLEMSDNDPIFHKRPPSANLIFRTFDGEFINKQVTGTQELGQAISELDDLYVCAARRYFKFFTGVNVNIRDFNDPMSTYEDSTEEVHYRNLVIRLGKDLKEHQSLNKLIEAIISSPYYITPGKIN